MKDLELRFYSAGHAFTTLFREICEKGQASPNGTTYLRNVGFYLDNPLKRDIDIPWRNWNPKYAQREWQWYLSQDPSVKELKKYAPIWDKMHGGDDLVNSNYGRLWNENDQLQKVINQLKENPDTRQAYITIFDGKRKDQFTYDTPCTLSIGFVIENGKLCMNVSMRSNDIWFGFCNDQYCFSLLQETVADSLELPVGWYYHHANDLHVYDKHLDADKKYKFANTYFV